MRHFKPEDNPLKDVKVKFETDFDPERVIYRIINGTDEGYRKQSKLESIKERNARDNVRNF